MTTHNNDLSPNKVFLNMMALRHNIREIKNMAGARKIMAVLSSDAYGHGLLPCAKTFVSSGVDFFSLDSLDDAMNLRANGIENPIFFTGQIIENHQAAEAIKNNIWLCVFSQSELNLLSQTAETLGIPADISLHLDSGDGLNGFTGPELSMALSRLQSQKFFSIKGLSFYTPFECAFSLEKKLDEFEELCAESDRLKLTEGQHVLNSRGLVWRPSSKAKILRVGSPLYGLPLEYYPLSHLLPDLRPVMTVLTRITSIYDLQKGDYLSVDSLFRAPKDMRVAATPFGMSNGLLNERMEPESWVLIKEKKAPLLGRVGMFQSFYDVSGIDNVKIGDVAVILGRHCVMEIDAGQIAKWCSTSPREITSLFGRLNPKHYEGADFEEA